MRKTVLISVAAAAFCVSTLPAQAAPASSDNSQASARQDRGQDAAADPNRRICVSERLSGSRMPRRVCRTAREWQLLQGDDENDR
jgi:hypothetical protein